MARSRYRVIRSNDNSGGDWEFQPYFVTCTIVGWLPLFMNPDLTRIVLDSLQFLTGQRRWRLYAYVIMENHLHAIASSEELSKEIGHFKSFTARSIVDFLKKRSAIPLLSRLEALKLPHKDNSTYQVWQEGSHPQLIADEKMMNQKIHYLHNNPVRRGYVDKAADWRYSSARSYEGKRGLIDVVTDW